MLLRGRLFIPGHGFLEISFHPLAVVIHHSQVELRFCIALRCRLPIPGQGALVVLRYALTDVVHEPQIELRGCISLRCSFLIPGDGLPVVLRHASAFAVHDAEVELCRSVSLRCGFFKPGYRLLIVLRHALTLGVHHAQVELRIPVSARRSLFIPERSLSVILRHALSLAVHEPQAVLGRRVPLFRSPAERIHRSSVIPVLIRLVTILYVARKGSHGCQRQCHSSRCRDPHFYSLCTLRRRLAQGDELFGYGRVDADGRVELAFGGAALERHGEALDDLAGVGATPLPVNWWRSGPKFVRYTSMSPKRSRAFASDRPTVPTLGLLKMVVGMPS